MICLSFSLSLPYLCLMHSFSPLFVSLSLSMSLSLCLSFSVSLCLGLFLSLSLSLLLSHQLLEIDEVPMAGSRKKRRISGEDVLFLPLLISFCFCLHFWPYVLFVETSSFSHSHTSFSLFLSLFLPHSLFLSLSFSFFFISVAEVDPHARLDAKRAAVQQAPPTPTNPKPTTPMVKTPLNLEPPATPTPDYAAGLGLGPDDSAIQPHTPTLYTSHLTNPFTVSSFLSPSSLLSS